MLLSSEAPVVRQFLNALRQGPIGMAEEKDANELEAEAAAGVEMPPLPPIPLQLAPTNGQSRPTQQPPGKWCRDNGVTPPPGSFLNGNGPGNAHSSAPTPWAHRTQDQTDTMVFPRSGD
jgi:phospholipid/cholesterol/gamma-HCH transport system ATP-binding protein